MNAQLLFSGRRAESPLSETLRTGMTKLIAASAASGAAVVVIAGVVAIAAHVCEKPRALR